MARSFVSGTLVLAVAVVVMRAPPLSARQIPEGTKSLYVSVLDDSAKPVKDMTADEFRLREDGADRTIVSVGPAKAPLQVVVLVDTSDSAVRLTQDIRTAVGGFVRQLHSIRNDAAIELMEFGQAPIPATPFVTADDELSKALIKMVGKPGADAVLLEALTQANADLAKRPSARRAIVSLNIEPSNELSLNPNAVRDAFRKSGAQLWALSLQSRDISIKASETN